MSIRLGIPYTNCPYISELPCTSEEEAIAIAIGFYLGGRESIVFMQNSGYGRCIDIITSFLMPYDIDIKIQVENRKDLHHHYMSLIYLKICEELKQLKK